MTEPSLKPRAPPEEQEKSWNEGPQERGRRAEQGLGVWKAGQGCWERRSAEPPGLERPALGQ